MIKRLLYWVAIGLLPACAIASTSTVTATVSDTDGQRWTNGSWSAQILMPGGIFAGTKPTISGAIVPSTASGTLDATGIMTAVLTDTSSLDQSGVQWQITVCPNASVTPYGETGCAVLAPRPIVGATVDLTAYLNAVVAPRFPAGAGAFGYRDGEVRTPSVVGVSYFNTSTDPTLAGLRLWDGHRWVAGGGAPPVTFKTNGNPNGSQTLYNLTQGDGINLSESGGTVTISQGPTFAISTFTGGQTVEIGASVTNPGFSASYTVTPASAAITNTDGISSPTNLLSPFTSGTVTGAFTKASQATTTFTLTAIGATTKTATQTINWSPRVFGGVGSAGATSATASGTNAVLSGGGSGTLSSAGISNSQVNQIFGPYSPANQKIYLLIIGNAHTNIVDNLTGFAMPFNTPTPVAFTNQNGSSVTMYLYESTNLLNGTFNPKVAN